MLTNNQPEQHNFKESTENLKSYGTNKYGNTPNNSYSESENSCIYMNDKFHNNGLPSGISVCSNVSFISSSTSDIHSISNIPYVEFDNLGSNGLNAASPLDQEVESIEKDIENCRENYFEVVLEPLFSDIPSVSHKFTRTRKEITKKMNILSHKENK